MCNDYRLEVDLASILEDFAGLKIRIDLPEGLPNVAAREDIRITDVAPIVRGIGEPGAGELVNRRWSWPGRRGPVYNLRKEGFPGNPLDLGAGRCLILADGFYEFTDPEVPRGKDKRLDKWLFTLADHDWFCIAGLWQADASVGEAFAMLTMEPGEGLAPYHDRQIIPLPRERWADWLDPARSAEDVLTYLPPGSLAVRRVWPPADEEPEQTSLWF